MKKQISKVPEPGNSSDNTQAILEIVESFLSNSCGDEVTCLEAMLFEWYQHYALYHYDSSHTDKVVNSAFRINDLLLKLQDAIHSDGEDDAFHEIDRQPISENYY
jgi:hypothetical protein